MKLSMVSALLFAAGVAALSPRAHAQQAPPPRRQNASSAESAKYVGLRHGPSLPRGLKEVAGGLVSEVNDAEEYSVSEVRRGRVRMFWFEAMTHRDSAGRAYWEVIDVLVLPPVSRKQVLVFSTCFLGKKPDKEIAAIADYQRGEQFFTRVRRAWRANRQTKRFEAIPVKGVKCENDGYGI